MSLKNQILKNLEMNGFPQKKVALPLEKMYEIADTKGENLNVILGELQAQGIEHNKTPDKIVFQFNLPNFDSETLQKAQEMLANMSEDEKANLMEKARAMGFI